MKNDSSTPTIIAFILGVCIGGGLAYLFLQSNSDQAYTHPIADPYDTEYHVHADFRIFVDDEQVELSDEQYMTTSDQTVHKHAHLHDGNGEVKHIHAENITFAEFLSSIDITLTDDCLTLFEDEARCSGAEQEVLLYVNEARYSEPISEYVPVDDDRILLYYGDPTNENIQTYAEAIPDDSCYYSGTCPERGVAPPESCGLTCEL